MGFILTASWGDHWNLETALSKNLDPATFPDKAPNTYTETGNKEIIYVICMLR